ncbi:TIGR04168 family protein [Myxacorys almedinensis]|uniref:TIGR04168 family protein n=1 Tax=Myxacorys almedinensis A TaxID=2690445 RepID=A0A8J7Z736_9CYAN|nr:TIGR04168 family protein [Myxacorys almedinensis]NDJ16710.1 TIGR04168 family protein [Myxacorys almedinensis A]
MAESQGIRIAAIGDIHDRWESEDEAALEYLGVDLALFVGDFGNESVEVVRQIANINIPKAAIMGNHDAWYNATDWGISKCPYDRMKEDRVQQQLDLLGDAHVGFGKLDFPELNLSVVGSRPFSWGGSSWKNNRFYRERFGVQSFEESAERIVSAASATQCDTLLFIGHNGPLGMGEGAEDPCGKDWQPIGGDHGDPDFAAAIAQTRQLGKTIPFATFGHMHHTLRHTKEQTRRAIHVDHAGTVYLNAANVPRIVERNGDRFRNFSIVTLHQGLVSQASLLWLNRDFEVASEQVLYQAPRLKFVENAPTLRASHRK